MAKSLEQITPVLLRISTQSEFAIDAVDAGAVLSHARVPFKFADIAKTLLQLVRVHPAQRTFVLVEMYHMFWALQ